LDRIEDFVAQASLVALLQSSGQHLATAESVTGGALAKAITDEPGASGVFLGSVVAYQNAVKQELVGVSAALMAQQGSVDAEVAAQLAVGIRSRFAKVNQLAIDSVIGISTTGVAGPGESEGKAAGTVFIGISSVSGDVVFAHSFVGDRSMIREQSVQAALEGLREQLQLIKGY
jgi:nicotinamide-nucleotide amidase